MHSFEVEKVEKRGKDAVLSIAVLPNRMSDALSHVGVAREIAAITGSQLKAKSYKLKALPKLGSTDLALTIAKPTFAPRYLVLLIDGVTVKSSPKWMRARLEAVGVRAVNNLVDVTNYVMLEAGYPLHAFDYEKIHGREMRIREAKAGEKLTTLDGISRELPSGALVIEDKDRLIDLAGIMGGEVSAVSAKTKTVLLQAAIFDKNHIRETSKRINHKTEASVRYAAGLDPAGAMAAMLRALQLLTQTAGGRIRGVLDIYPKPVPPTRKILLLRSRLDRYLGFSLSEKDLGRIGERLSWRLALKGRNFLIDVPSFRLDLEIAEDLIEEIGRIYGYEKIQPELPLAGLRPPEPNERRILAEKVRQSLVGSGWTEVLNYTLGSEEDIALGRFRKRLGVENPLSPEKTFLRPSLLPGLLRNIEGNLRHQDAVRLFEIGKVFYPEHWMLGGALSQKKAGGESLFFEAKGALDLLFSSLGLPERWFDNVKPTPETSPKALWEPGRGAEIKVGNEEIGFLGEVRASARELLGLKEPAVLFEIEFEKLLKLVQEEREYRPIPKYPAIIRDIAMLVDRNSRVADILNTMYSAGGPLVQDIDLFDYYEGEPLPEGKKNLAFHVIYQAEDRTLREEEAEKREAKIKAALKRAHRAEIR